MTISAGFTRRNSRPRLGPWPMMLRVSEQLWAVAEDIVTDPEPIEHSVDKTPSEEGSSSVNIVPVPEPIEHSVDKRPSEGGSSPVDIVTVPDPIEHSDVRGAVAPPSTGQRMEHLEDFGEWQNGRQSHTDDCDNPVGVGTGGQEAGEAIVVGAGCQVTILAMSVFE